MALPYMKRKLTRDSSSCKGRWSKGGLISERRAEASLCWGACGSSFIEEGRCKWAKGGPLRTGKGVKLEKGSRKISTNKTKTTRIRNSMERPYKRKGGVTSPYDGGKRKPQSGSHGGEEQRGDFELTLAETYYTWFTEFRSDEKGDQSTPQRLPGDSNFL